MKRFLKIIKEAFCDHEWSAAYGYDDRPNKGAHCVKCKKVNA